mmetsp:Transcript_25351/g.68628  ORF Transcript_25351/g.68628 Transcript_25351/m.68628 type:complete len:124 (+) Transcript_25351:1315-1686(+)
MRLVFLLVAAFAVCADAFVGTTAFARAGVASAVSMKYSPIRSGVEVQVIAGDDKGKTGKVLSVDRKPKKSKNGPFVLVEGVNIITKHVKPRARGETGKRTQKEAPIHISNVKAIKSESAAPSE